MKVEIIKRPLGLYNGEEWPEVGKTIDLPDYVAEGMKEYVKPVIAHAPAKKAAAKETRPRHTKAETRES